MPEVKFTPSQFAGSIDSGTKILVAAKKSKVKIRFGCSACRCGTCAVAVEPASAFSTMKPDEKDLLHKIKLSLDGTVRLACQARIESDCNIDIDFQDSYSP
jgi:ferredoxin